MAKKGGKDNTDPQLDLEGDELERPQSELLGSRTLSRPSDEKYLLRLGSGYLREKFASVLGAVPYKPSLGHSPNRRIPPLVIGPFTKKELAGFVDEGLIEAEDTVLKGYDRWRGIVQLFPELRGAFGDLDDVTATSTASASGLGFDDTGERGGGELPPPVSNTEKTPTEGIMPSLEVEAFETEEDTQVYTGDAPSSAIGAKPGAAAPLTRAQASAQRRTAAPVTAITSNPNSSRSARVSALRAPLFSAGVVLALIGGIVVAVKQMSRDDAAVPAPTPPASGTAAAKAPPTPAEWPARLQPLKVSALYENDDNVVKKIRPILRAYQNGTLSLSPDDEKILRVNSQEGVGSNVARRLAANQLAVYYLSTERPRQALEVLKPVAAVEADDPTTLLNLALINFVDGNNAEAEALSTAGARLAPRGMEWVASAIVGMIAGAGGRIQDAARSFTDAQGKSSNNPFIYGIWIQNLLRSSPKDADVPRLIREVLWADPDRLIDSPVQAPLAGHIIVAEALDGIRKGSERADAKLTRGQAEFLQWLAARGDRNPVRQPLSQVMDSLASEDLELSQLLHAYLLKEQGRIDDALTIMTRIIPLIDDDAKSVRSSWPWTFFGDLQMAKKKPLEALVQYQSALKRNTNDVSALHGLAMAFRSVGDYTEAESFLSQSLSQDPFFVPSILRIERLDWHRPSVNQ